MAGGTGNDTTENHTCSTRGQQMRELLARVEACTTTDALWALMLDYWHAHGFSKFSYHHITGPLGTQEPITIYADGFKDSWVCTYIEEKLFLVDPITDHALREPRPFLWEDIPSLVHLNDEQRRYLDLMGQAQLGKGLAFQVFGPGFRNGYVGLGFATGRSAPTGPEILEYQFAAQAAHAKICALMPLPKAQPNLSRRERDVLTWIARGKSNSVIADILGLSPHTVDTLMRRVYDKLGTRDRTTAAIAGVGAGLILP